MPRTEVAVWTLVILVCWTAAPICAQDLGGARWDYRIEAFGDFSAVHVRNLIVSQHRDGIGFAGGAGWRPFRGAGRGLGFELRTARIAYDGTPGEGASNYDRWNAWLVAANALYHFRSGSRVQPYLLGGFGFMRASGSFRCADCGWNRDPVTGEKVYIADRRDETGWDHGPLLGGGLKIAVTRHVFLRAELSELFASKKTHWSWSSFSVGVGIRY